MSAGIGDFVSDDTEDEEDLLLKTTAVEYDDTDSGTVIHLFGRDGDRNRHHVEVVGHNPSFFIRDDEYSERIDNHYAVSHTEHFGDDASEPCDKHGSEDQAIESCEDCLCDRYTTLYDEPLVRVYTHQSSAVGEMRDLFDETWEADVLYDKRWLIDNEITVGARIDTSDAVTEEPWLKGDIRVENKAVKSADVDAYPGVEPRKMVFDIEVASEGGFPDADKAEWPVSTIVAWDSYTDEYVGWLLRHETHMGGEDLVISDSIERKEDADLDDLRVFDDESAMLDDFHKFVSDMNPDIITGWNSNGFDIPYLFNRSRDLNTYSYRDWSPLGEAWDGKYEPVVKGRECVDMMEAYEKTQIHELDSKALDDVAADELGTEKVDVEESHTQMWKDDPIEFLRYNKVDTELVHRIDEESGATEMLDHLRNIAGVDYTDLPGGAIEMIDMVFLRKAAEYGYRLPTAVKPEVGDFRGAWVYTPEPGLHEHVAYPDYSSLYPNEQYQCNISPETLIGTKEDLEASEYTEEDCVWSYIDTKTPPEQKEDVPIEDHMLEKVYFLKPSIKEGFVRAVLDDIMGLADRYTGGMYEAAKRVRNACFTPDTEVVTSDGIVNIRDVSIGDEVYSWNPDTSTCEIKTVTDTWAYPEYDGELVDISTSRIDFSVTPNHDMWVNRSRHTDEWEKVEAGNLNDASMYSLPNEWSYDHNNERLDTVDLTNFTDEYEVKIDSDVHGRTIQAACDWSLEISTTPYYIVESDVWEEHGEDIREVVSDDELYVHESRGMSWTPMFWDGDDFVELLAWYITEGSTYTTERKEYEDGTVRGECNTVSISQYDTNDGHRDGIKSVLEHIGLVYYESDRSYEITGAKIVSSILESCCGSGSYNKKIPSFVFDLCETQKRLFFETMMKGDGDADTPRYTTASKELRDGFVRLVTELGRNPRYRWEGEENREGDGVWRIYFPESKNTFTMSGNGDTSTADDGVYCITVEDNHTVLAGRNGNFQFVGQSWGVMGDSDSYGDGFRLFDWRLAEATTLGGQKVLKGGAEKFVEEVDDPDAYIAGGDTDSYMTSMPNADSGEHALELAFGAAESTNEWLDGFAVETFGLEDESEARMELEVESYAGKLFFKGDSDFNYEKGVKKRYAQRMEWDDTDFWYDEPETKIKGFEYVRSDVADITKELQYETFEIMLDDDPNTEERVKEVTREKIDMLFSGDHNDAIGKPFGIGQPVSQYGAVDHTPQPQYRGAKFANSSIYEGEAITEGDKPKYFYIEEGKTGPELRSTYSSSTREDGRYVDAISVHNASDLPKGVRIDYPKMAEKAILDPMRDIWKTMGWGDEWAERYIKDATPPEYHREDGQTGLGDVAEFM